MYMHAGKEGSKSIADCKCKEGYFKVEDAASGMFACAPTDACAAAINPCGLNGICTSLFETGDYT